LARFRIEFFCRHDGRHEAGNEKQGQSKRRHEFAKYPIMPVSRCSNMWQWNIHFPAAATKAMSTRSLGRTRTVSGKWTGSLRLDDPSTLKLWPCRWIGCGCGVAFCNVKR